MLPDIAPGTAAGRKMANRDRYERDLALLSRVRDSYRRQAEAGDWLRLDGERGRDAGAADVLTAVETRLARPETRGPPRLPPPTKGAPRHPTPRPARSPPPPGRPSPPSRPPPPPPPTPPAPS